MNTKKPQSKQEIRAKVDSGLNRNRKSDIPQKRAESAVQSQSGEKELQSEQNLSYQRTIQDKLYSLVQDYLLRCNYTRTLEQFENESQFTNDVGNQQEALMLAYFDRGERDQFLKAWNQYIPLNCRQDHESWKLEFYIQIYFLIYPIHPYFQKRGQIDKQSINAFKQFLDSKGEDLSKTNEVLPFYALPYVQQPQKHQTFQHLFTQEWVQELKERIREYTSQIFSSDSGSQLQKLVMHYETQMPLEISPPQQQYQDNSKEVKKISDQLLRSQSEISELRLKLNQSQAAYQELNSHAERNLRETQLKWFQFSRDLMTVSKDLLKQIEGNQNSQQASQRIPKLRKTLMQYDRFLSQDIDDLMNKSQDISLFEKVSVAEQDISNITSHQQIPTPMKNQQLEEYIPLNYSKIILLFTKSNDYMQVASVLQALRWRITRAKVALQRRQVVVAYATHDIIGTHQKNILLAQYLILKAHPIIQCQTLKLLNALASDYHGRTYLTTNPTLIKFLVDLIKKEQTDSQKRKNAIGALQKMSLRRQSQNFMLENNIIYHTLIILKNEKFNLSEYTYEYITALIMNLSLSSRGKDELTANKELAFEVLYELIEYPNDQIRTFTNGTFYSLFSRKSLRDFAYNLGIPDALPQLLENSDEKFKKQIQYMITQLEVEDDDYDQSQMEEENDVDDIEDEEEECVGDDEEEDDLNNQDMIIGEELLQKEFELVGDEAENQKLIMDSIILKEVQQRNAMQEQIRESQLERMPVGQLIPFYNETTEKRVNQKSQVQQKQIQGQGQQNVNQNELKDFAAKPKIPRTPPDGPKKQ